MEESLSLDLSAVVIQKAVKGNCAVFVQQPWLRPEPISHPRLSVSSHQCLKSWHRSL